MKIEAIIFDVDGTLVETEEIHRIAFNKTFLEFKLNFQWTPSEYNDLLKIAGGKERLTYYLEINKFEDSYLSKKYISKIYDRKRHQYRDMLKKNKQNLRPGVNTFIRSLRLSGIKIGIASASSYLSINSLSRSIWGKKIDLIFDVVVTGDDVKKKKPDPDVYLLALKKLKVSSSNCIAIEDSRIGLLSAKAAGIKTIITPSIFTNNDNFDKADFVIPNLKSFNLPQILKKNDI